MYNGDNPTAIRSQDCIEKAVMELLADTNYEKLNVKEICAKARVSRQTFYRFFVSKQDVMQYCIRKQFIEMDRLPDDKNFIEMTRLFAEHISKNREFIRILYRNKLDNILADELSKKLTLVADRINPGRDEKTKEIANVFLTAALTQSLLIWSLDDGVTEEEYIKLIEKIVNGKYYNTEF